MIKIIIQEETEMDEGPHTYMKTIHDITSENRKVIADSLRSIANSYDPQPPQAGHRRGLPTVYKGE